MLSIRRTIFVWACRLLLGHRLRVDVHGCADIRVAQKFLLNLQIFPIGPK